MQGQEVLQIQCAFYFGAEFKDQKWIEAFYDYPMINAGEYANTLIKAGERESVAMFSKDCWRKRTKVMCEQLKRNEEYGHQSEEFRAAIEGTLSTAKASWTRFVPSA